MGLDACSNQRASAAQSGFQEDIRPLIAADVEPRSFAFDLRPREEECEHAEAIYSQLADAAMRCEASWPEDDVEPSRGWIDAGMPA